MQDSESEAAGDATTSPAFEMQSQQTLRSLLRTNITDLVLPRKFLGTI